MKETPLVTICMAAFNASAHIATAIESVIAQTYQNWELIVVDDGSSDNTEEVVENYARYDGRIRVIRQENTGPGLARRAAYLDGQGAYFISLDDDDRFSCDTLELLIADALTTGSDVVMADMMRMDQSTRTWRSFSCDRGIYYGQKMSGQEAFGLTFPWVVNGRFLVRRELIVSSIEVDNFFNNYNCDEYLTRVYCLKANRVFASKGIYYYELNSLSISSLPTLRRLSFIQTDRMLLKLAVDAEVPTNILLGVLREVDLGLIKYAGFVGQQVGNGSIKFGKIWKYFNELRLSEKQFLRENNKLSTKVGNLQKVRTKVTRYAQYAYWFTREYAAQQAFIVKAKKMIRS